MNIKKYILSVILLCAVATVVSAQDTPPKKTDEKAVEGEIEIVRPYKPVLAEAFKLRRSPDLENVQTYKAKFNYTVNDRKLELNTDINKLEAQKLADERPTVLVNNYIKLGGGSLSTLLAEGYINTGKDEALQAGVFFRHFGQQGKIEAQDDNRQQFTVFGKSIMDDFSLSGKFNYQRHGTAYYGFDPASQTKNIVSADKQALSLVEAEGEIISKFREDDNAFSYAAKLNVYNFNDKFDAKENIFTLSGSLNKRVSDLNFGLGASAELGTSKDLLVSTNNNLVRVNPYIRLQTKGIKITAGINFVQQFGSTSESKIFPMATADLTLVPEFLQFFAEVKGDVTRNNLRDLTNENPFLGNDIILENSAEKLKISAGVKGTGGPGFGYKVMVYSSKVNNMPFFVNRFSDVSRFDVIYDRGNTNLTGVEGSLTVQVADDLTWTGKVNLEQYKTDSETFPWMRPQVRANSDLSYTINNKLTFNASVYMQGDSKTKLYTAAPAVPYVANDAIETIVTVKGFVDLGAGIQYKVNNKFGAFARVNNLLNTNYNRFLYYPSYGFNIFGGISYSF